MTKKELKESYKQLKFPIGVFQIRNTVTGKVFISSSVNLDAIWNRHHLQLKFGMHPNEKLQADWNAFGADNFLFEILDTIEQKGEERMDYAREVRKLEEMYKEELAAVKQLY